MTSILTYLRRVTAILGLLLGVIAAFSSGGATELGAAFAAWVGGLVLMALAEMIELLASIRDQSQQSGSNSP